MRIYSSPVTGEQDGRYRREPDSRSIISNRAMSAFTMSMSRYLLMFTPSGKAPPRDSSLFIAPLPSSPLLLSLSPSQHCHQLIHSIPSIHLVTYRSVRLPCSRATRTMSPGLFAMGFRIKVSYNVNNLCLRMTGVRLGACHSGSLKRMCAFEEPRSREVHPNSRDQYRWTRTQSF